MNAISDWYNKDPTRRVWLGVGAPVVGLVFVMMALSTALLWSFARQQDDEFARASRRLVENAIEGKQASLADMTLDYANWDAAVAATARRLDRDWLEQNYYSSVLDAIVVFRGNISRYAWVDEAFEVRQEALAAAVLRVARASSGLQPLAAEPELADSVVRTVTIIDGQLAMISVAPITYEDDARRMADAASGRALDFIVTLQMFDRDDQVAMGANFGLHNLRVEPPSARIYGDELSMPIVAASGEVAAIVAWRHERPGTAGFARLAGSVVLTLLVMGFVALVLARRLVLWQLALAAREQAARESARLKTEFIATMSHELRTPLNGIIGYAEIIEEDAEAAGAAGVSIQEDAQRILAAARHLSKMIADILEQSKIEAGRLVLEPEAICIAKALAEVTEVVEPAARVKSLRLITALDSQAAEVFADPAKLRQCLLNLAANAIKFTDHGVVALRARATDWAGRAMVAIDVIDTGIGIAPEDLQRLFSPFAQANPAIASRYGGAGLGLSISRKLARAMGGDIIVSSVLGEGSVFTLILPRTASADRQAA